MEYQKVQNSDGFGTLSYLLSNHNSTLTRPSIIADFSSIKATLCVYHNITNGYITRFMLKSRWSIRETIIVAKMKSTEVAYNNR